MEYRVDHPDYVGVDHPDYVGWHEHGGATPGRPRQRQMVPIPMSWRRAYDRIVTDWVKRWGPMRQSPGASS